MIGKTTAQYKIIEKLGSGGMGIVYKAHDTKLDRYVALKMLPPQNILNDNDRARFLQEARTASSISHPNICIIHDFIEIDDQEFILMEYVEGRTVREIMRPQWPIQSLMRNHHLLAKKDRKFRLILLRLSIICLKKIMNEGINP
jgi:serine/threonine protein kinase